jgi:peptide/nickel transport system ATP-binding protein
MTLETGLCILHFASCILHLESCFNHKENQMTKDILAVENLSVHYLIEETQEIKRAVDDISFVLREGEFFGITGQSGSGKTTVAKALLGIVTGYPGVVDCAVTFDGKRIVERRADAGSKFTARAFRRWHRNCYKKPIEPLRGSGISAILQQPKDALNPYMPVWKQVAECIEAREHAKPDSPEKQVSDYLTRVGLKPEEDAEKFPHALSIGMCQRVCIAMILALKPKLIIADEPTTKLDLVTQHEMIELLMDLKVNGDSGWRPTMLLITHELGVLGRLVDKVAVMNDGRFVEPVDAPRQLFFNPQHSYTQKLVESYRSIGKRDSETVQNGRLPPPELVQIKGLNKTFRNGEMALRDISFQLGAGESVGLVGKSGGGKTTLARIILGVTKPDETERIDRSDLPQSRPAYLYDLGRLGKIEPAFVDTSTGREFRRRVQMVYQEASEALPKRDTILYSVAEAYTIHWRGVIRRRDREALARQVLSECGLKPNQFYNYPHQLSGGECKRALIARALAAFGYPIDAELTAGDPLNRLLLADEPVSGLDAVIRTQILELIREVKEKLNLTLLVISHNLEVIKSLCDAVVVLKGHDEEDKALGRTGGEIVELGRCDEIFDGHPENHHPYTQQLLDAKLTL